MFVFQFICHEIFNIPDILTGVREKVTGATECQFNSKKMNVIRLIFQMMKKTLVKM